MRVRRALLLSIVSLVVVACSLACKRKAPPNDTIQSDPVPTKDAGADAAKKQADAWERFGSFALPASCELVGIDAEKYRVEKYGPDVEGFGPRKAVLFLDAKGAVLSQRELLPDYIASTADGRIQYVIEPKGTMRIDVDTKTKTPWKKKSLPEDVSADGKLVVTTDIEVYDVATEKKLCAPPVPWAGGSEGVYRFESGGRWLTLMNSRGSYFIDPIACKGDPIAIGQRFRFSATGDVIVVIPHQPFAMDWFDRFVVIDGKTGDEVRDLALKIPLPAEDPDAAAPSEPRFDATLTPRGDRLAVVLARELIVLSTSDGKVIHRESVADLVAKDDGATLTASDAELALSSGRKVTRFALPLP